MVTDYVRDDAEDSVEHRETLDLLYHFTRTLFLGFRYQHWDRDYDRFSSDYTSDQLESFSESSSNTSILRQEADITNVVLKRRRWMTWIYLLISLSSGDRSRLFRNRRPEVISCFLWNRILMIPAPEMIILRPFGSGWRQGIFSWENLDKCRV